MTDRQAGLVQRAVERIQTQHPDHAPKTPVILQMPDPPQSAPARGAPRDAASWLAATATPAGPSLQADQVATAASFPTAPPSWLLWGSIAFGCAGLLLAAGLFIFLPRGDRPVVASAPPPAPAIAAPAAAPPPPESQGSSQDPHPAEAQAAAQASSQIDDFMALGNDLLSTGDIASARLYFERAAEAGNGRAARLVGKTYDAKFLNALGVHGMRGDPEAAAHWYQRARELGDADADGGPSAK